MKNGVVVSLTVFTMCITRTDFQNSSANGSCLSLNLDQPAVGRVSCSVGNCSDVNVTVSSKHFQGYSRVTKLYISECTITENAFENLKNLKVLSIENGLHGHLPMIMFYHNRLITKLHLRGNDISNIPATVFHYLPNLKFLDLSVNKIPRIPPSTFQINRQLRSMNIPNNQLTKIEENVFCFNDSHLQFLYLAHNRIDTIDKGAFRKCSSLSKLDLSFNEIKTLPEFDGLTALKTLYLSHNKIRNIYPSVIDMIKKNIIVKLNNNRIKCNCVLKDEFDKAGLSNFNTDIICFSGEPWNNRMLSLQCGSTPTVAETRLPSEERDESTTNSRLVTQYSTEIIPNSHSRKTESGSSLPSDSKISTTISATETETVDKPNEGGEEKRSSIYFVLVIMIFLLVFIVYNRFEYFRYRSRSGNHYSTTVLYTPARSNNQQENSL